MDVRRLHSYTFVPTQVHELDQNHATFHMRENSHAKGVLANGSLQSVKSLGKFQYKIGNVYFSYINLNMT